MRSYSIHKRTPAKLGHISFVDKAMSTAELAALLGVHPTTIRKIWIPEGCPHTRGQNGHIMLNGLEIITWLKARQAKRLRFGKMQPDQAFCFTCRQVVNAQFTHIATNKVGRPMRMGTCTNCHKPVSRYLKREAHS